MADFKKLRQSKTILNTIEPLEIFRRLPKPAGINDLYNSQAQVLNQWFERRNDEKDLVIKLHTGGGKTLVGLLIAQSILNEYHEPVIYLAPTNQLVDQIFQKAIEYNIPAVTYKKKENFSDEFVSGKSVLICTYNALFNGCSRFGISGSREYIHAAAIILDDAHAAFSTIRDIFTLKVEKKLSPEMYSNLTNIFRDDFNQLGKIGTFDDITSGAEDTTVEVPYWSWKTKCDQVRASLKNEKDKYQYVWSLLRDNFDYCHCLISSDSFVITPIFPLVDMIPTFQDCSRRIFMSATISDDSAIIRTFDANAISIGNPITSNSLAGVSERMIVAPELMEFDIDNLQLMLKNIAKWAATDEKVGSVVLVPSNPKADPYKDIAIFADSTEKVASYVKQLQDGHSFGPFVFANRYDGIDLPGSSCRLLILDGLPRGTNEYDRYRMNIFGGGNELVTTIAQKIEQGMGRGARGAGDYCVVIITGKDMTAWFSRKSNRKFLTESTRAQFDMGMEISKTITNKKELKNTILQCFNRDKDWTEYHAESLAELTKVGKEDDLSLEQANTERKAFSLLRDGYFEKAIDKLNQFCNKDRNNEKRVLDSKSKGWVYQMLARTAYYWNNVDLSHEFQQHAYSNNNNLLRPQVVPPYIKITIPGEQSKNIIEKLEKFNPRRGYLSDFDEVVAHLVPEASNNQFEQSLAELGLILGFNTQRPGHTDTAAPDVLWLLPENLSLVIEAKSRKKQKNAFKKEEHGQLLTSVEWFKREYPNSRYIRVSLHPTSLATKSNVTGESKALTSEKLNKMICDTRSLLTTLCESSLGTEELIFKCEQILAESSLKSTSLITEYLVQFNSQ